MSWFAAPFLLFRRSLALHWVALVTAVSGMGILLMLGLTYHELQDRLETEGMTMQLLAEQKTAERIDAEIGLVNQRLRDRLAMLEDNLAGIAGLPTSVQAIRSRNDTRIAEDIGRRLRRAGFSGGLVLDHKLAVIGADRSGADLLAAQSALRLHDVGEAFRDLLENNDSTHPNIYRYVGAFDAALSAVLLAPNQNGYGTLLGFPVFDPFGEPLGMIIAYSMLRLSEPSLVEFAQTTKTAILALRGALPVSVAGPIPADLELQEAGPSRLRQARAVDVAGRCGASLPQLQICVLHPRAEISKFRDELIAVGAVATDRTIHSLIGLAGIALLSVIAMLFALTRRLTRPLREITQAVGRVARGEWRVQVDHAEREDEIGSIARAVASMQISLIERDRMRQEILRIDAINQRRLLLDSALGRFEGSMAVVMANIGGALRNLGATSEILDRTAREADLQAERIRASSEDTASKTTFVTGATLQLSQNIREIGERVQATNSVVFASESRVRQTQSQMSALGSLTRDAEDALAKVQGLIADLGHAALSASLQAMKSAPEQGDLDQKAATIAELAAQSAEATQRIGAELQRIVAVADGAVSALSGVESGLGTAFRETSEISIVVAEQNAATRAISDGLASAGQAMAGLTEAVHNLRQSMGGAQEATAGFVITARRMVEDARAIDASIRSFVREVAA